MEDGQQQRGSHGLGSNQERLHAPVLVVEDDESYAELLRAWLERAWSHPVDVVWAQTLRDVDLRTLDSAGYSFQVELKFLAARGGHNGVEIPIRFEERTEGVSKMNLATQIESAIVPLRLRLRNRRG